DSRPRRPCLITAEGGYPTEVKQLSLFFPCGAIPIQRSKDSSVMSQAWSAICKSGVGLLLGVIGAALTGGAAGAGQVELPVHVFAPTTTAPLAGLVVYPPEIQLTTARDRQSIVVQAMFADGITRDVTREASMDVADLAVVRRNAAVFYP